MKLKNRLEADFDYDEEFDQGSGRWHKRPMSNAAIIIVGVCALLVIVLIVYVVIGIHNNGLEKKKANAPTVTYSSLEKAIPINELETVEYPYNAIARKYVEGKDEPIYYVAYQGTVTAGINFENVDTEEMFSIDENKKIITITIPDVEVQDIYVNMGSMQYIFSKKRYETESISQEAYKLCIEDLRSRVSNDNVIYEYAEENAKESIKALAEPFEDALGYEIEVKSASDAQLIS